MTKKIIAASFFLFVIYAAFTQDISVYPTHWWTGMKMNTIQLILHSNQPDVILAVDKPAVMSSSPDFRIKKVHKPENKRYLILDVFRIISFISVLYHNKD